MAGSVLLFCNMVVILRNLFRWTGRILIKQKCFCKTSVKFRLIHVVLFRNTAIIGIHHIERREPDPRVRFERSI